MEKFNWKIEEEVTKKRLDKYISENTELTRTYIQKLILDELVLINGEITKSNYKLKINDEIELTVPDAVELEAKAEDIPLNVVFEDSDVIVINKPKGLVVHPGSGNPDHTLVNALLYHCKDLSGINGVLRPGIVHRIDKDTTGLLVCCKNDKSHLAIANQLMDKTCTRKYTALVHGVITHEFGTVDAPIGRSKKDRKKMTVTSENSRNAITHFKVVERFRDYTLIECELETGRTHQIRVHMEYIKYPIVGDFKYSKRKVAETTGQMLHAYELSFNHPTTKERVTFHAPLPKYFEDYLEELRFSNV
jgi:23S rRNA pseudouridine1911/1915/1917 synthase